MKIRTLCEDETICRFIFGPSRLALFLRPCVVLQIQNNKSNKQRLKRWLIEDEELSLSITGSVMLGSNSLSIYSWRDTSRFRRVLPKASLRTLRESPNTSNEFLFRALYRWVERCQTIHQEKLRRMRSCLDNTSPKIYKHLVNKQKKVQLEDERFKHIEQENHALLHKISKIMRRNPKDHLQPLQYRSSLQVKPGTRLDSFQYPMVDN